MEQKINDGGPAFPVTTIQPDGNGSMMPDYTIPGISIRDYFAAKAMQGAQANVNAVWHVSQEDSERGITWADKAETEAYQIADAMLRARAEADAR